MLYAKAYSGQCQHTIGRYVDKRTNGISLLFIGPLASIKIIKHTGKNTFTY